MCNVYLPVEHSEADLALAGQVAELLESDTLYVTWSRHGYELPEVEAVVFDAPTVITAAPRPAPSLAAEVLGTMAAFFVALFTPRSAQPRNAA